MRGLYNKHKMRWIGRIENGKKKVAIGEKMEIGMNTSMKKNIPRRLMSKKRTPQPVHSCRGSLWHPPALWPHLSRRHLWYPPAGARTVVKLSQVNHSRARVLSRLRPGHKTPSSKGIS